MKTPSRSARRCCSPCLRPSAVAPPLVGAYAGGPTSVLMVNPDAGAGRGRAYHSDRDVQPSWWTAIGDGPTGCVGPPRGLGRGRRRGRTADLADPRHADLADRPDPPDQRGRDVDRDRGGPSGEGQIRSTAPAAWHRAADPDAPDWPRCPPPGCWATAGAAPTSSAEAPRPTRPVPAGPATPFPVADRGRTRRAGPRRRRARSVAMQVRRRTPAERPDRVTLLSG